MKEREPKTDKRNVLRLMRKVRKVVADEIRDNAQRGSTSAVGLSSEGFAGGYLQALDDVDAALRHGYPSDHRGYWKKASERMRAVASNRNTGNEGGT